VDVLGIVVDVLDIGDEIDLVSFKELGPLDDLPADIAQNHYEDHTVLEDELVGLERAWVEERVSADDEDDGSHNQSVPSGIWLESRAAREERLPVETLYLHGVVEADPGGRHDDPVEKLRRSNETDPPVQDFGSTGGDGQVRQAGEANRDDHADVGNSVTVQPAEEAGSLASQR